jgi:hypothetical protein
MTTPLPPVVSGPITELSTQVYVDNVLPNSVVTVYDDPASTSPIGTITSIVPASPTWSRSKATKRSATRSTRSSPGSPRPTTSARNRQIAVRFTHAESYFPASPASANSLQLREFRGLNQHEKFGNEERKHHGGRHRSRCGQKFDIPLRASRSRARSSTLP